MRKPLNKADGLIQLDYRFNQQKQQVVSAFQQQPLRVLFPEMHEIQLPSAVLINTAGGILGGDQLQINVNMNPATKALITSQAAEKVYFSDHHPAIIHTNLKTAENCWLEWLPQETILFDGSRFNRYFNFEVSKTSKIMAGEILLFGRTSRGEKIQRGCLKDKWSVMMDGELLWEDRLHLEENSTLLALEHPAGFNRANAYATFIYISQEAGAGLKKARDFLSQTKTQHYATLFYDQLMIVRWLSSDALQLRQDFSEFWCQWRYLQANLPPALPRIWHF